MAGFRNVRVVAVVAIAAWALLGAAASSSAQDAQPPALRIVVLEGEDSVNIIERGTAVPTLVEVRDRNDLPVSGATVVFLLGDGGTATLNEGLQQVSVTTNALGQAEVAVNPVASGPVELSVSATFGGETATAAIVQTNFATAAAAGGLGAGAIVGIAAAAAGAAVGVGVAVGGDDTPPPPPPPPPPSAPFAPTLEAGDRRLAVSWSAPSDNGSAIVDYDVRYRPSGGTWTDLADAVGTATTATITGLDNGTTYEVQVRARNAVGVGPWSASATGTPASVPSAPSTPTLEADDGQLTVSWRAPIDNGSAIDDYDVRYRPAGGTWSELAGQFLDRRATIANLTNGTSYEVQVRAGNSIGKGPWSASARGTPMPPITVPDAPTAPTLRPGNRQMAVSWSEPADNGAPIIDYDLRHRPAGGDWSEIRGRTTTSLLITGLTNGTTYEIQVRARNSVGRGPWSASARGMPGSARSVPDAPSAPALTPGDGRLAVSWRAPADNGSAIDDYDVRYRRVGGGWTELPDGVKSTATTATIRNLTNGTAYQVQVRAGNAVGDGPWSASATGTPQATARVTLSVNPSSVTEGEGSVNVEVTARLSRPLDESATVDLTLGGTADPSADYDSSWPGGSRITIGAGSREGAVVLRITPKVDAALEPEETIEVLGTSPAGLTVDSATLRLLDGARPTVTLLVNPSVVAEGDGSVDVEVRARLSGTLNEPSTVDLTLGGTADPSADYDSSWPGGSRITIGAGSREGAVVLRITPVDDALVEPEETIEVLGRSPGGLTVDPATVRLLDNDEVSLPTTVTLSVDPSTLTEGEGWVTVEVTARLSGALNESSTVDLALEPGTADASDYDSRWPGGSRITIPAGSTEGSADLWILPKLDALSEGEETLAVTGTSSAGLPVTVAALRFLDGGVPTLALSVNPSSVTEGEGGPDGVAVEVTASLSRALDDATTVDLTLGGTADPSADYDWAWPAGSGITIAAGSTQGGVVLRVWPQLDVLLEDEETIEVAGTSSAGLTVESATLRLLDKAPSVDRDALVDLYDATNGPNWRNNANWNTSAPLDQWHGVSTDQNGRVSALDLGDNQLSGSIPASLGNLANLLSLSFWDNQLSGSIPTSLGNLANLTELYFGNNQLSGSIPASLGNLANLTWLGLENNQLTGSIPSSLGSLTNVTYWALQDNQLTGSIPSSLGSLTNVTWLGLSRNQLTGPIPSSLGSMTNLVHLYLHDNDLSGSIPPELGQLGSLRELYLYNNRLDGSIPDSLCEFEDTINPQQSGVNLTGCAASEDRAVLMDLYNSTEGPNWERQGGWGTNEPIGDWEGVTVDDTTGRVTRLDLEENRLSGSIPSSIGNLTSLEYLHLYRNQLRGSIPPSLGNLANLRWLDLFGNRLTGGVPSELGRLTKLEVLQVLNNQLTGVIPPELGRLADLQIISFEGNQLTGGIPPELGRLTNLQDLILDRNQLTGGIPPELGRLTNLQYLSLSDNELIGSIPAELGQLGSLAGLHLQNNRLGGSIPESLCKFADNDQPATGR